jgi:hypothetical protein
MLYVFEETVNEAAETAASALLTVLLTFHFP